MVGECWLISMLFLLLPALTSVAAFIIKRENSTLNLFTNPGGCYRPNSCTVLSATCYQPKSAVYNHCCNCACKQNKSTFFSLHTGCSEVKEILSRHKSCLFTFKLFGNYSIPVFPSISHLNGKDGELDHSSRNSILSTFPKNPKVWCYPRRIYFITRYGKEVLAFENSCLEILNIETFRNKKVGEIRYKLKFNSNKSDWEVLNGKLVKTEILCKNISANSTLLSSCLFFQVNGSYNDEKSFASHHSPVLCPPAPPYIPEPTTPRPPIPIARTDFTRIVISASVSSSIAFIAMMVLLWVCLTSYLKRRERLEIRAANRLE